MLTENKQASAQPLCSSLDFPETSESEGRQKRLQSFQSLLRAIRTSSGMLKSISGVLVLIMCHIKANQNMPKNMPCQRFVQLKTSLTVQKTTQFSTRFKQANHEDQGQPKKGISFFSSELVAGLSPVG